MHNEAGSHPLDTVGDLIPPLVQSTLTYGAEDASSIRPSARLEIANAVKNGGDLQREAPKDKICMTLYTV